jgi:di/tricarboxylate transporter
VAEFVSMAKIMFAFASAGFLCLYLNAAAFCGFTWQKVIFQWFGLMYWPEPVYISRMMIQIGNHLVLFFGHDPRNFAVWTLLISFSFFCSLFQSNQNAIASTWSYSRFESVRCQNEHFILAVFHDSSPSCSESRARSPTVCPVIENRHDLLSVLNYCK